MKLICPKCKSENIDQYRMPTGAIWCKDCHFLVSNKEINNPFIFKENDIVDNIPKDMTFAEFDRADEKFKKGERLTDKELLGLLSRYDLAFNSLLFLNKKEYQLVLSHIEHEYETLKGYAINRKLIK